MPVESRTGKSVGFDFGLKRFLTASDGHDIDSPDFFRLNQKRIRMLCRKISRKQKGSHNRECARKNLARAYRRMENQRHDFHFKTARRICEDYALVCLETLTLKGMAKLWGRKIHSLGFYEFVKIPDTAGTSAISGDTVRPVSAGSVDDARIPRL